MDLKLKLKLKFLAENDNRSMSNYIVNLLERDVLKYELENGEIKL